MARRVVITGSSGLLGGAVARELAGSGAHVVGVDHRRGPHTTVVGDLRTLALAPALDGADAIVHLAALHAPHVGRIDDASFHATNVEATARLLDASRVAGVSTFVFASTTSVYGHALDRPGRTVWVDEALVPEPRDIYDVTKLAAEDLVRASHGPAMRTVTLRIARCFPEPWRTTVVNRLSRGVDQRDVVAAVDLAVMAPPASHEVVNVAGPRVFEPADLDDLAVAPDRAIARRVPWLAPAFAARGWPLPTSIDRVYVADRAASVIGYRPAYGARDAFDHPPATTAPTPPLPRAC